MKAVNHRTNLLGNQLLNVAKGSCGSPTPMRSWADHRGMFGEPAVDVKTRAKCSHSSSLRQISLAARLLMIAAEAFQHVLLVARVLPFQWSLNTQVTIEVEKLMVGF